MMKSIKNFWKYITGLILGWLVDFLVLAEGTSSTETIEIPNPLGYETFTDLLAAILKWLTIVSAPITAVVIIFAGFKMITAGDKEETRKEAKKTITYAVVGYIIILLSWSIVLVIKDFLGVD